MRADLALLCSQRGDHQAAREHAQKALELARALGRVTLRGLPLPAWDTPCLADLQEAEAAYLAALRLCQELGIQTLASSRWPGWPGWAAGEWRRALRRLGPTTGNCPGG